jgi:hypothetical protein
MRALALLAAALLVGCSDGLSEPREQTSRAAASNTIAARAARSIGNPFPDATEVRLFVNDGYDDEGSPTMSAPAGRPLSRSQRKAFEAAVRIEPAPDAVDACFIPHHFFRYFDKQGRQIGEIEVCFCCDGVSVSEGASVSPGPNEWFAADYTALRKLVQSMGERTDIEC